MAAIYHHSALYSRDSSEIEELPEHSRNLSSISSTTLHTNTTSAHSQPNEPLLHPSVSPRHAVAFCEPSIHETRPADGSGAHLRWSEPPAPFTSSDTCGEKSRPPLRGVREPWRWRQRLQFTLQVVIAIWSAYNAVRYFMAFRIYGSDSSAGHAICLALGTSAAVSFAITCVTLCLSTIKGSYHVHGSTFQHMLRACFFLQYLASSFLFAPAILSFAFVFIWKNSSNPRYNIHNRCHLAVDTVWSVTTKPCHQQAASWSIWLALSCIRFIFTFLFLAIYHTITLLYPDFPRRPQLHHRLHSGSETLAPNSPSVIASDQYQPQDLRVYNQQSDASLGEATLRDAAGRSVRLARSRSPDFSGETARGETQPYGRTPTGSVESESKCDQNGYGERFRSLLTQISQEADAAVEYARHDTPESVTQSTHFPTLPPSYSQDNDDDDSDDEVNIHEQTQGRHNNNIFIFNRPPLPPILGYNEFGLPYPPDQDVRMLNGYIRRMPTIESMGSGEVALSIGASSAHQGGSIYTSSRPPTRNTLLSFVSTDYETTGLGSNPPSRANSLSARAELLLGSSTNGTSEHGELIVGRSENMMRRASTPNSLPDRPLGSPNADTFSTGTSGSRGTNTSYHTATTGSSGEPFRYTNHHVDTPL